MELTILMPCLNEINTLGHCIEKARTAIEKYNLKAEILIADNGSTDGSIELATHLGVRVVTVEEKGYGIALRRGIEHSAGKYIIMGDSDSSYDFEEIIPFIEKLRQGYDLVIGNRFKGEIKQNAMPMLHKYLGNPVLSFITRLFYRLNIGDVHCGLRAFNKSAMLEANFCCDGMEFASEMIVKSSLMGLKMTEVPITLYPDGRSRPPHLRSWPDGWRHLKFLLLYSPRWLFLYPGLFCIFTFLGTITFFDIYLHITLNPIIFFSILIIGFQLLLFYCFTTIYYMKFNKYKSINYFIRQLEKIYSLEKGLLLGLALICIGILVTFFNIPIFSRMSYEPSIHIIILALTCLVTGIQIIFNSFFISILRKTV